MGNPSDVTVLAGGAPGNGKTGKVCGCLIEVDMLF